MKKHRLKNCLKLGILLFGIILLVTNCETDEEDNSVILDSHVDNSIEQISPFELTQSSLFKSLNTSLPENNQDYLYRNQNSTIAYEFLDEPVLVASQDGKLSYTASIRESGVTESDYNIKLLIQEIDGNINYLVLEIPKQGGNILVNQLNTAQQVDSGTPSVSGMNCVTTTTEITTPCGCGHYDDCNRCPTGNPYPATTTTHKTTCYYVAPPVTTFEPPAFGETQIGGSSGLGIGGASTSSGPQPIYIYEGEQQCFSDGTCTPPLYWAQVVTEVEDWSGNSSSTQLMEILNTFSFDSEPLTDAQKQWINNHNNIAEIDLLLNFLTENNNSTDAKEFAKATIGVLSLPRIRITSINQIDYKTQILKMTNHLKKFGNIEDEIYADYIESLIPEFSSMTINEVREIYSQVKKTCNELTIKYAKAIITPIVTDLVIPVVTYALLEATAGTAIKLLQKIPISMVLRGARLNKMVIKIARLGAEGVQGSHIRELRGTTVSKAQELFITLTKNAVSTTNNNGVIVANMGNGSYITFRTVSSPLSPNVIATIDLNFPQLFSEIIKLKFYP